MTINVFAIIKSIPVEIHVFTLDNTYFAFDSRFYRWITCFCYPKIIVIKKIKMKFQDLDYEKFVAAS